MNPTVQRAVYITTLSASFPLPFCQSVNGYPRVISAQTNAEVANIESIVKGPRYEFILPNHSFPFQKITAIREIYETKPTDCKKEAKQRFFFKPMYTLYLMK